MYTIAQEINGKEYYLVVDEVDTLENYYLLWSTLPPGEDNSYHERKIAEHAWNQLTKQIHPNKDPSTYYITKL